MIGVRSRFVNVISIRSLFSAPRRRSMQCPPRDLDLVSLNLFHLLTASLICDPLRVLHLIYARCPRVPFSGGERSAWSSRFPTLSGEPREIHTPSRNRADYYRDFLTLKGL